MIIEQMNFGAKVMVKNKIYYRMNHDRWFKPYGDDLKALSPSRAQECEKMFHKAIQERHKNLSEPPMYPFTDDAFEEMEYCLLGGNLIKEDIPYEMLQGWFDRYRRQLYLQSQNNTKENKQ